MYRIILKRWPKVDIEQNEVNGQVCHVRTLAQSAEFVKLKSKRPSAKQATD